MPDLVFDFLEVVLDEGYPELGQLLFITLPFLAFLRLFPLLPLQRSDPLYRHVRCRGEGAGRVRGENIQRHGHDMDNGAKGGG